MFFIIKCNRFREGENLGPGAGAPDFLPEKVKIHGRVVWGIGADVADFLPATVSTHGRVVCRGGAAAPVGTSAKVY